MKVLHIGKYFAPERGGIETHLLELCQGISKYIETEAIVFSRSTVDSAFDEAGFRLHRVPASFVLAGAPFAFGLSSKIASCRADIVHLHHPNPTGLLAYLQSGHTGRLIVTYHSDIVRQKYLNMAIWPMHELVWRRCSHFIATSPNYIESSPVLSRYREKTEIIPLGVNLAGKGEIESTVKDATNPDAITTVLAIGRLVKYKGFECLVDACALLQKKGLNFRTLIVGDGPGRKELEEQIHGHALGDKVLLLGDVADTTPYFQSADLLAFPSIDRNEAFGLVQVEAMAWRLPVINTWLASGVPYVSLDGVTGLTVKPNDAPSLADALERLITDHSMRVRFGTAARHRAVTEFSAPLMTERTLRLYEQVLHKEKP